MDLSPFFKAIIEAEQSSVVICDLNHTIIYMNPFAINRHHKDLTGQSLMLCHNDASRQKILKTIEWFQKSTDNNQVLEFHNDKENRDVYMVALRDDSKKLIGYFEKHLYRNQETAPRYDYK